MTCRSGVASLLRGFPKAASVASHRLARPAKVGKADKTCNPIQSFNLPRLSPDLLAGGVNMLDARMIYILRFQAITLGPHPEFSRMTWSLYQRIRHLHILQQQQFFGVY